MKKFRTANILLVDDDRVDVVAITTALEDSHIGNPVYVASDGVTALELLRGANGKLPLSTPVLVLLDLNMPRMNGIEFLEELRSDPALKSTIVFVLTTSDDRRDISAAYGHNVAGYIVKSRVGTDFINLINLLKDYKLIVEFPVEGP